MLPAREDPSFAGRIQDDVLEDALKVGTARAAAQNQTLGNLRTRTAALLPTAAVSVTFATSIGLLGKDATGGALHIPTEIAAILLFLVLAIGAVTVGVQWPVKWDFDSGTSVYADKVDRAAALRAAVNQLEDVVRNNSIRLRRLFLWFEVGVLLLALETALAIYGLIIGTP